MRGVYRADYQGVAHSSCSPFTAGGIRKVLRVKELAATVHRDFKTAHTNINPPAGELREALRVEPMNGFETNVPFLLNSSLQSGFVNHL